MFENNEYQGGENFNLHQIFLRGRNQPLTIKTGLLQSFLNNLYENRSLLSMRRIISPADREVMVLDPYTGLRKKMLMFGSNNYLGLANHPHIRERVRKAIHEYGVGVGGPPLLNGYTYLHRQLEERLAAFKQAEDCLIFSSGYGANVGLVTALLGPGDTIFYDEYSHASFCDGLKMANQRGIRFPHNDVNALCEMISKHQSSGDTYIGVEGVYSMDGDVAPLDEIVRIKKERNVYIILDDAHGSGVMGQSGHGTAEHFGLEGNVDITMGTFSKAFGVTGGFITSSKPIVNFLRYFSRPYMFSASLPPVVVAAVLGCLDVIDREPELLTRLRTNIGYAKCKLRSIGFELASPSPILPLRVPEGMDIRRAAYMFHERDIFVNSIEYPAVPLSQQRFRISLMAIHSREDIDRLVDTVKDVWMSMNENICSPTSPAQCLSVEA
jgi:glycine C-acetyltransferase